MRERLHALPAHTRDREERSTLNSQRRDKGENEGAGDAAVDGVSYGRPPGASDAFGIGEDGVVRVEDLYDDV